MDEALLICRVVLAGVFVVAAATKEVDLARARDALDQLGVRAPSCPPQFAHDINFVAKDER